MPDRDEQRLDGDLLVDWRRWSLTARGRVSPSWAAALAADPLLRSARVIVDVVVGQSRRVTVGLSERLVRSARDGSEVVVMPCLDEEPTLTDEVRIGVPEPSSRSVSVSFDGRLLRPSTLVAARRSLSGQGEVSLVADGVDWDERIVHVRGPLSGGVQFGADDEMVDVQVSDPPIGLPEIPAWILDEGRFPEIADDGGYSVGARIPLIVGGSYRAPCLRVASTGGVLDPDDFLVGQGTLTVDEVLISTIDPGPPQTTTMEPTAFFTTEHEVDGRGLPVTLVRFVAFADATEENASVYASAHEPGASGRTLVRAVRRLLQDFGLVQADRISDRLFAEADARLGDAGLVVASGTATRSSPLCVVNQPVGVLDYVTGTLLAEHPHTGLAWDGAGIGPIVIDHRAEPVAHLEMGRYPAISRPPGGRYRWSSTTELRTQFVLRYSYDPTVDQYLGLARRSSRNSSVCEAALAEVGFEQPDGERQSITIYSESDAEFVVDWLVEHYARPWLEVEVDCYPIAWLTLRSGDPVRWTDADVGLVDEPALILRRTWARGGDGGGCRLLLRIYPQLLSVGGGSDAFASAT